MSGNPTGSNVVPMPHAATPAPAQPPMPMPFPMWGGGGSLPWGPGCCPPGGMDALLKCYCDVQAATAFICSVMVQCIQQNPAVTAAIIAAIEASGSTLPLVGVTNGSDAQPGQVGEYVRFQQSFSYPTTPQTIALTMGVLEPGDWDVWAWLTDFSTEVTTAQYALSPQPAGFVDPLNSVTFVSGDAQVLTLISVTSRALISVPSLVNFSVTTNNLTPGPSAGAAIMVFQARRRR